MDAGEVRVRIEADASDLQSGVDSAKHKLDELAKKADELSSKMDGLSNKSQSVGRGVSDLGNAAHDAGGKVGTLGTKADDAATHAQNAGAKVADAGKQIDAIKQKDAGLSWQGILAGDKAAQSLSSSLKGLGSTLTKGLTVPLVAIGGISAKSAIEFESSFAGVRKTVDATEEEFQQLSKAAREMAQTKPVDVNDINLIMELGGQLGVAKDALGKFADVISDLDVSTNMNVEEASTQLAQFMNITGQSYDNVDRLGATIVALGNNSATTEADIMNMAMRIAGAGHGIGLADDQILALSASLSSVGIEAEAGGTAISTIMSTIDKEVATNGDTLDAWAKAAGMSASEFKAAWASDTMGTIQKVFSGIGESGENLNLILEDLGVDSIRQTDLMKRMSSASQILSNSVEIANKGWQENTALVNEASRRYETNESKMQMAANKAKDVAITLGGPLADALSGAIDAAEPLIKGAADLAQGFANLDKATQQQIIKWGLLVAAAGPVLTTSGKIIDSIGKINGALGALRGAETFTSIAAGSDRAGSKIDELGKKTDIAQGKVRALDKIGSVLKGGLLVAGIAGVALEMERTYTYISTGASDARKALDEHLGSFSGFGKLVDDAKEAANASGGVASTVEQSVSQLASSIQSKEAEINTTVAKAIEERRQLTQDEISHISELQSQTRELQTQKQEVYQTTLSSLSDVIQKEGELTASSAANYYGQTQAIYENSKASLDAYHTERINEITSQYAIEGSLSKEQYDAALEEENKYYQDSLNTINASMDKAQVAIAEHQGDFTAWSDEQKNSLETLSGIYNKYKDDTVIYFGETAWHIGHSSDEMGRDYKNLEDALRTLADSTESSFLAQQLSISTHGGKMSEAARTHAGELLNAFRDVPEGMEDVADEAARKLAEGLDDELGIDVAKSNAKEIVEAFESKFGEIGSAVDRFNSALEGVGAGKSAFSAIAAMLGQDASTLAQSLADAGVSAQDMASIGVESFARLYNEAGGDISKLSAAIMAMNSLGIDPKTVTINDDDTITTTDGKLVDLNNMTIDGKSFTVSDGQTIQENTDEVNAFDDVPIDDKIWEVDNGGSVGDNTTEVDTLTGSINAIPKNPSFTVTGNTETAQSKVSNLLTSLGNLAGKVFSYVIQGVTRQNAAGGVSNKNIKEIPRHADGGFKVYKKPTLTNIGWVGEDGAEAIIPLTNRRYVRPFARAVATEVNANLGAHIASDISGAVGSYVDTQYRTLTASNSYIARLGSAALKDASGNKYALNALAYTQSSVSDAIAKMSREIDEQSKSFESGANSFIRSLESGASSQSASLHSLEDVVKKVKEQAVSIGATLTDMAASDKEAYNNLYMLWGDLTDFHYDFNWYAERANAALGAEAYATGGISPVPLKSIPAHAKGGFKLATRPTLTNIGWVGEDGAEAIVPLTNRRYVRPFAGAVASEVGSSIGNRVAGVTTASIADYADKRFSAVDIAIARYQQEAETSNNIQASAISAISLSQKAAKNVYDETLAVARYIKTVFSSLSDSAYDSAVSLGEISKCLEAMAEADKSAYTNQYMMWGDLTDFHYDFNWYAERANAALGAEENARGGISSHAIKEIPAHAKGGFKVANRATLTNVGWVGEDGAEAIVPLSNRRYVRPFANAVATEVDSSLGSHVANSVVSGMASYTDGQFSALDVAVARYAKSAEVADELQTTALNAITLTQQAAEGVYKQTLQVTSNIETMLGAAGTKIKETADGVTAIKDTLAKMAEADTQAYSNQYMMWGDLTDFHYDFNWYAERANAALGAEENATGGIFRHSIKEIPAHAKGGFKVANKPTLTNVGWVGEDGSEAIVPLSNRRYVRPFASAVATEVDGGLGSKISGDVVGALASYTDGQFSALDLAVARYSKNAETAQELQTTALNAITLTQQAAENVYKQTLQVTSNIETVLGAVGTKIKEMADNITAMKDTLSTMSSADEQAYSNQYMMWGDLTDFHYDFNWYAERANAALGAEAYATGGISPVPLKAIPANAKGGFKVASKPTLTNVGWVGEDGTEAIVPLSNRKYVRPFASAVAAEVSEFVSSSAAQKLAYGIAPYIASNIGAAQMANNQIQQTGAAQVASTESLKPILTELLGAVKDVGSQVAQVNVNVAGADMTTPMDVRQLSMQLANHTASQMRAKGVLR